MQSLGKLTSFQCLEISEGDGSISMKLRSLGGSWKTAVPTRVASDSLKHYLSENVGFIHEGKLPYEDNSFDRLVIVDALKFIENDYEFIKECHRVLRNDAWVVISESKRAPVSLVSLLQNTFGLSPINREAKRKGYSVHELFDKLKDGFDVPETIVHSNGLLESASTVGEIIQKSIMHSPCWLIPEKPTTEEIKNCRSLFSLGGIFYPLAKLLSLFEFIPGHKLLIRSRRRHWRPRLQPKLIDGRSIAEAAINTKIGTAAPF